MAPETKEQKQQPRGKTLKGVVVSTKMKDTASVEVRRYVKHPKYGKYQVLRKRFLADDKGNVAKLGETVTIVETRPISKRKYFKVVRPN
jgi:small subunit ribosomal protein S17